MDHCPDTEPGLLSVQLIPPICWPNPGPGRLPLESGRGDVELAGDLTYVASLAVSFMSECIFWDPVDIKKLKNARAMAG